MNVCEGERAWYGGHVAAGDVGQAAGRVASGDIGQTVLPDVFYSAA